MLRDLDGNRIMPLRIKHFPGVILDVVLSTPVKHTHIDPLIATASLTLVDRLTKIPTKPYLPGGIIGPFNTSSSPSAKGSETDSIITSADSVPRFAICVEPSTDLSPAVPRQSSMTRRTTTYMRSRLESVAVAVEHATQSGRPLSSAAITALISSELVPLLTTSLVASADESNFRKYLVEMVEGLTITGNELYYSIVLIYDVYV
ncbi:hypothetical protein BGX21_000090 [Mortierella sp. AD011]|nr:hypothetical protein BGX21_000090 [Mortierella sp. AD011]